MLRLILSNRWLALLWVALVALSATRFAGKDGQGIKAIDQAAERIRARNAVVQQQAVEAETTKASAHVRAEPLPGEGYDPTPVEIAPDQP